MRQKYENEISVTKAKEEKIKTFPFYKEGGNSHICSLEMVVKRMMKENRKESSV